MPVDRFFHPRAGHSRKVTALTDCEFRVWWTYQMAADDYGVMRRSVVVLQAANDALDQRKTARAVKRALDRLVDVGLLTPFEHQGEYFVCQLDWQDFQKVRYPRESLNPVPTPEILLKCSRETAALFRKRSGEVPEELPEDSSRAGAREEANGKRLTADGQRQEAPTYQKTPIIGRNPHIHHAACDPTLGRCVPAAVHQKFIALLAPKHGGDHDKARLALEAWYPTVWATLPAAFVMGDAFKFWQARFDAQLATPVAPVEPARDHAAEDARVVELALAGRRKHQELMGLPR